MLRVPPFAGADGAVAPASPGPLAAAAEAQRSRLADAAWMLESETSLLEGFGQAMNTAAGDGAQGPAAPRFDSAVLGFIEKLFAGAPDGVSEAALGQARTRADAARSVVTGAWQTRDDAAGPDRALDALRRNLTGLFRDGRQAGAASDEMTAAALGRIELLRGALPDEALAGIAGWSRGMAAAAHLDGALARGDADAAETALADPRFVAGLPEDARSEFARRADIVRRRSSAGEIRRELRDKVESFGRKGGGGEALDRAVEKAAGSARIRDEQERNAFGWSLRADLARTRTVKEARRLAVERDFRARLADSATQADELFALLDRAETEGLLDADRLARLRREQAQAFERRAAAWRTALDGARHLADPSGFDRTDKAHRAAVDAWWREVVEGAARDGLDPDAAEAGLFADIRSEAERALPGAVAGPDEIARDVAARTGYLPAPVAGRLLATWRAGGEAEIAGAAELAAGIAAANTGALQDIDPDTAAGLLATAAYFRGGAAPEQAIATARREVAGDNGARLPDSLPELLAGGDEGAEAALTEFFRRLRMREPQTELRHTPGLHRLGERIDPEIIHVPGRLEGFAGFGGEGGGGNGAPSGGNPFQGGVHVSASSGITTDYGADGPADGAPGVPAEDGGFNGLGPEPEGIAQVEDVDGQTVVRDPDTGEVIGETDFKAADAIAAILHEIGLGKDFDSLTEDEKQALIDAAAMIPGLGEGISTLQAYEAALAATRAWENGDYGEAALQSLLAGLDAAGAIPGIGKAFKAVKIFGGFLGRAFRKGTRKLAEQAGKISGQFDSEFGDYAMAMAGNGPGSRIPGPRPDGSWNDKVPSGNGSKLPGETGGSRGKVPGAVDNPKSRIRELMQETRMEAALNKRTDVKPENRGMHENSDANAAEQFDRIIEEFYPDGISETDLKRIRDFGYDPSQKDFLPNEVAVALQLERTRGYRFRRAPKGSGADFIDELSGEKIDVVGGPFKQATVPPEKKKEAVRSHFARAMKGICIVFDVRGWSAEEKQELQRIINSEIRSFTRKNPKSRGQASKIVMELF